MNASRSPRRLRRGPSGLVPVALLLAVADGAMVFLCAELTAWFLMSFTGREDMGLHDTHRVLATICALTLPLVMHALGGYRYGSTISLKRALVRNASAWFLVLGSALILTVMFKISEALSRLWIVAWAIAALGVLLGAQVGYWSLLRWRRRRGVDVKRVVIVGDGEQAARLLVDVVADPDRSFELIGYLGDAATVPAGVPCLGAAQQAPDILLGEWARDTDEVWVLQSGGDAALTRRLYYSAGIDFFDVRFVPDLRGFHVSAHAVETHGSHVLLSLSDSPHIGLEGWTKMAADRVGAALGLLLLAPVFAAIALAIVRESPGPVFYRQLRHGLRGRTFTIYKFRTMRVECGHTPGAVLQQVARGDVRVTRIGRMLRRYSLDELPQLFNVLRGDMSLVGPRPHEVSMNVAAASQDTRYRLRHRIRPGMTGWAQIHGFRGPTTDAKQMARRLEFDLWYIEHWSLWLDLRILLATTVVGFGHQNAF